MIVAEAIVKCLEIENINTIFGYPGGAILPLYEALRTSNIKHILVRNEQSSAHSASGYARASQSVGVCISTSGPGATNMITGIATAYMDSIPMIIITGQVKTHLIGKDAFQEADIVGATEPFTKHNYLVKDSKDIMRVISKAFKIATTGRPGPVLIDIPRDILMEHIDFDYLKEIEMLGYNPTNFGHSGQIKRIIRRLKKSTRPVIYSGGGVILSDAMDELLKFAKEWRIPVVNTMMGIGSFPMDSPYYAGIVGFHGDSFSDEILSKSDLIIIIGARMSDRATKNFSNINPDIDLIHIDIDPAEIGKTIDNQIPVVGNAKSILTELIRSVTPLNTIEWMKEIESKKGDSYSYNLDSSETINPKTALRLLSDIVSDDTVVTADVGQNQIWAARNFKYSSKRRFLTSGGLGTMGYSLPAAIGAKLAVPDKTVVAVMGDGGIQMLIGELGTLYETKEKVIVLLFNNSLLGMVRELQDGAYGKGNYFGIQFGSEPDFIKIGEGYGIKGKQVTSNHELEDVYAEALSCEGSFIIECIVDPTFSSI